MTRHLLRHHHNPGGLKPKGIGQWEQQSDREEISSHAFSNRLLEFVQHFPQIFCFSGSILKK